MTDSFTTIGILLFFPSALPCLSLIIYLTLRQRGCKYATMIMISQSAPEKFRERAMIAMESNASWIMASQFHRIWFSKLMLRYAWNIPAIEISSWGQYIDSLFHPYERQYVLAGHLSNIMFTGLAITLVSLGFEKLLV